MLSLGPWLFHHLHYDIYVTVQWGVGVCCANLVS